MKYCSQSEVGEIRSILVKHPGNAFIAQENIDAQWEELNYFGCPDFNKALKEYEDFINLLAEDVSDIYYLPENDKTGLDSIYTHDPVIITKDGAILCKMGKEKRQGEPAAAGDFLSTLGIPVLGTISGKGQVEGGDVVWLDERALAVGWGYRTNEDGIRQLKKLMEKLVDEFIIVPLPHWRGPGDVLHLMSLISPIDYDLAVVYSRLLPVPFRQKLIERGIKLLEVPDSEYETIACNILTTAPRKCIVLSGNPHTKQLLEKEGVIVREYTGEEISIKGAGGPTCLTRPLLRIDR